MERMMLAEVCQLYGGEISYHRLADQVRSGVIPAHRGTKSWSIDRKDLPLVARTFGIQTKVPQEETA